MTSEEVLKKIAFHEFIQDQLMTELEDLDDLLRATGFPRGIASVKEVAYQMLEEGQMGLSENS
ncbi:MAG: hypothetical protein Q8K75_01040 [Chlamydiales bacterium]|jgi:hypothetical protein|nr:hypothetical protein [Chlamydiales bacterium]